MELFDFIKVLFERPEEYAKLNRYEKAKHFFMVNRFMAISYPPVSNAFNHLKVSQSAVIDYWQMSLRKIYTKVPPWIYVKTSKKNKKEKIVMPSKEAISEYLQKTQMSRRDLDEALRMFGPDVLKPIHRIDKLMAA
jgi:hypothetical protein